MKYNLAQKVAQNLNIKTFQSEAVIKLLDEGATVPFISRYRKEATGSLDEVEVIAVRDLAEKYRELEKRRNFILKSIEKQDKLTPEIEKAVEEAQDINELEDIYLPFKPKKKTRAAAAREKGLQPLAEKILSSQTNDPLKEAEKYINSEKGIETVEDALAGARDIVAEVISEDADNRKKIRDIFEKKSDMYSKVVKSKKNEAQKFRDYFDWREPALKAPSHRILAVLRGMDEGYLAVHFAPDENESLNFLGSKYSAKNLEVDSQIQLAVKDSYKRLIAPSMENEIKAQCKKRADAEAIRVFAENARELLLASPLGEKPVLALDPGLRTGCKVVCLSAQGTLLEFKTIYPLEPHNKKNESEKILLDLVSKYRIEAIAVGNGTGGREALKWVESISFEHDVISVMVNESGASIYSASETARKEFPDQDVTVRGAVSIGRRLMDPLAELVKIDPKSIGVGQYQHDVDQKDLKKSLDDTVMSCVNSVGVEVNTSSSNLLRYVSGLSSKMAEAVVQYRDQNGPFKSRKQLKLVKGMGDKTFEQAAGFLRIRNAENPLDASAVHPESYSIVKKMASDLKCSVESLIGNKTLLSKINPEKYITDRAGLLTINDILSELEKPGRDPRDEFETFSFADGVNTMDDLKPGMKLNGVVTNVTAFGAFVDIGVHQDGLVHISQLSDSFVSNPADIVKVNQKVSVSVLEVDISRKRISLSMKE